MTCDEVLLELDALVRRELPAAAAEAVRAHLVGCQACRAEAAFVERLDRDLAATRPAPPAIDPARLADRALGAARATPPRRARSDRVRRGRLAPAAAVGPRGLAPALALAASVAVAVGASAWLALRSTPSAPPPDVVRVDPAPREVATEAPRPAPRDVTPAAPRPAPQPPPDVPPEVPATPEPAPAGPAPADEPAPPAVTEAVTPAPGPAPGREPGPTTAPRVEAEEAPALAGVLLAARGRAEASTDGGRTWSLVRAGDPLAPGARLRAPRGDGGVVAVIAPGGPPVAAAAATGARVLLAPGAEVALAGDVVRVAAGSVYVQAEARVVVAAANVRVPVERADAEVELARGGGQVRVWARAGEVRVGDVRLTQGQQVTIDDRGRMGRVRQDAEGPPRWAVVAGTPRQVIYHEPLDHWERVGARRLGRALQGVVAGEAPDDDPRARQVMFGKSQAEGGLFRAQAGARLRVKLRVARPTTVTVQVMDHSIPDNVHADLQVARAGLWTEVDVALERLDDNAKQGRRVSPGDLLGYVTVRAAADGAGPVDLEVDEITAYVP